MSRLCTPLTSFIPYSSSLKQAYRSALLGSEEVKIEGSPMIEGRDFFSRQISYLSYHPLEELLARRAFFDRLLFGDQLPPPVLRYLVLSCSNRF